MIIKIDTYEDIEQGVCGALDIDKEHLRCEATYAYDDAHENDRINYCGTIFDNWASNFVRTHLSHNITEMYVCHLARLIGKPESLMPLPKVLTTGTTLSLFLAEHNISFRQDGHRLILSHNDKEIPPEEIYNSDSVRNKYSALAYRMCYFENEQDFCVNGFAFGAGVENDLNGYFRRLGFGPEILMRLDEFLGIGLWSEYVEKSTYYKVYVKEPIADIIFDEDNGIKTEEQKTSYLIVKCIEHLAHYYCTGEGITNIPIVRFSDDKSVMVDHYEEILCT